MTLSDKLKRIKSNAETLAFYTTDKFSKEQLVKNIFQSEMQRIINEDLSNRNPDLLFNEYQEYFKLKALPSKTIDPETIFYRGRVGNDLLYGAEDDLNRTFILPYHGSDIEAPPPIYSRGGRFNREGTAYLYLASSVETCLAEVHLQIGQNCSIGEFKSTKKLNFLDLTKFNNDLEMETWLKLLTQPVHSESKHLYNITRFLSDVLKSINSNGIYFESVQSSGYNLVCFDPKLFHLIQYSEKIYTATKIEYKYSPIRDAIREYAEKSKDNNISSFNDYENDKKEEKFQYLESWIEHEREAQT